MECTSGYFGTFCNESCPPGRFGHRCGGRCSPECSDKYCNHVSGCHLLTKNTTQLTVSDRVHSPRTPAIISRIVEENPHRLASTSTISLFSETNTKIQVFSKETPFQKNEINTNYLLAGAGIVIFMLLIIIVIQTSRKSKSAKRNSLHQHKITENQTCDETFKRPPNDRSEKYLNITSSKQSKHFYQPIDPVYQEIDESVELMQIPTSTERAMEFRDYNLPKSINNSINVTKNDDLNAQTSKSYVLPSTCPDTHKADYLQPVFVHANIEIESKQETHSYIDVAG